MTKVFSSWKDHDHWQCLRHVPPVTLPAASEKCWFVGCSRRPDEAQRPEFVEQPEPAAVNIVAMRRASEGDAQCAFESCAKPCRDNSKYCSRACSNRNARRRHKARQKAA